MTARPTRKTHASGERPTCGAKNRQSGTPCKRPAGWGTDHPGEGRCSYHGGRAGRNPSHGIYSKAFVTSEGAAAYAEALEMSPEQAARNLWALIVAKAADAHATGAEVDLSALARLIGPAKGLLEVSRGDGSASGAPSVEGRQPLTASDLAGLSAEELSRMIQDRLNQ